MKGKQMQALLQRQKIWDTGLSRGNRKTKISIRTRGITYGENWKLNRTLSNWFAPIVAELSPSTRRLFMPIPSKMNGLIAPQNHFKTEGVSGPIRVLGKILADGVHLCKGDAFAIMSADCPTLLFWTDVSDMVFTTHCGLGDIIQFKQNSKGIFAEQCFSVVHNVLQKICQRRILITDVHARVICGIRTGLEYSIYNPVYGEKNLALQNWITVKYPFRPILTYGCIDMVELVRSEMMRLGVLDVNIEIDKIDTFSDRDLFGDHIWASHARDGGNKRNLVLIENH